MRARQVDITAYELVTANDNPGRDPSAWSMSAHNADGVFVILDERHSIVPPFSRYTSCAPLQPLNYGRGAAAPSRPSISIST